MQRTMILGMRILSEMPWSIFGSGFEMEKSRQLRKSWVRKFLSPSLATTCAWPWYRSVRALRAEQVLIACHNLLSTSTG